MWQCSVVCFHLPVQHVAKIDGEHLVLVSPDDPRFLEERKLKIVSITNDLALAGTERHKTELTS